MKQFQLQGLFFAMLGIGVAFGASASSNITGSDPGCESRCFDAYRFCYSHGIDPELCLENYRSCIASCRAVRVDLLGGLMQSDRMRINACQRSASKPAWYL